MLDRIKTIAAFLKERTSAQPEVGIILGSGLGGLVDNIEIEHSIPYEEIPDHPISTVAGHQGRLIFGKLSGKSVVAMQGRFHYYEGYSMQDVTLPVRVMKFMGITHLFVSNACGGVDDQQEIGDLMIITDHINLFPDNPLRGKNIDELGPRFPDMSEPYDRKLIARAKEIGAELGYPLKEGTYAGVSGPCLETPAEYRYVANLGAQAVGMSTVPEVIVARHMGIPCFGVSIITDLGVPGKIVKVTHEDVTAAAAAAAPRMTQLFIELIKGI
jgi:purine-nucleoside phosphorylase